MIGRLGDWETGRRGEREKSKGIPIREARRIGVNLRVELEYWIDF
jgi:hypothetical protein